MGYIVQSIVFDKNKGWDMKTAREWVKNHKEFSKPIKEEETINTIRVRLFPPKKAEQMGFTDYRMKTLASGDVGIMLDIAYNKLKGGANEETIEYEEEDPTYDLRVENYNISKNYDEAYQELVVLDNMRRRFPEIESEERIEIDDDIRKLETFLSKSVEKINANNEEIQRIERRLRPTGGGICSSKEKVAVIDAETERRIAMEEEVNRAFEELGRLTNIIKPIEEKLYRIKGNLRGRADTDTQAKINKLEAELNPLYEERNTQGKIIEDYQILIGGMNGFSVVNDRNFYQNANQDVPLSIAETTNEDTRNLPRLRDITGEKNPLLAYPVEIDLPEDMTRIIHQYEGLPPPPTAVNINPNSRRAFESFTPKYFFDTLSDYLMGSNDEQSRNSALPYLADEEQMLIGLRNAIHRENIRRRGRRRRGEDDDIDNITLDYDDEVSNPRNNIGRRLTPAQERDADEYETLLQIPLNEMTPDTQRRFRTLENKIFGRNRPFLQRLFGNGVGGSLSSEDLEALLAKSYHSKHPSDYKDFQVDKELSGQRVQVYHNPTTQQTIVAHRGTSSVPNWIENVAYAVSNDKSGKAFQHSKKIQDQAYSKYGKENITTIGHSKGALHAQEYGKEGKEVITLNKPVNITDALFTRVPKSQTDIRTQYDPVSFLRPFQRGSKVETIKSTTKNPLAEHKTSVLGRLDPRRLFGSSMMCPHCGVNCCCGMMRGSAISYEPAEPPTQPLIPRGTLTSFTIPYVNSRYNGFVIGLRNRNNFYNSILNHVLDNNHGLKVDFTNMMNTARGRNRVQRTMGSSVSEVDLPYIISTFTRGDVEGIDEIITSWISDVENDLDYLINEESDESEEEGAGMTGGVIQLPPFDVNIGRAFRDAKRRWAKSPKMFENLEYERKLFDDKYGKLMRYIRIVSGQGDLDNTSYVELLMYSNWVKDLEVPEISRGAGKKAKKAKKGKN
jgi:hypothetical protein